LSSQVYKYKCPIPNCSGELLEIWQVKRPDGGFGRPIVEHHCECDKCHVHLTFTEILNEPIARTESRKIIESLRRLGYAV